MIACVYRQLRVAVIDLSVYRQGEDPEGEDLSLAHHKVQEASRRRENPRRMRDEYFFASELYLACGHNVEAAACLQNAREHLLAARLWEKVGQVTVDLSLT